MNRPIKFRGKTKDGRWLYGDILQLNNSFCIAPHDGNWYDFMPPKSSLGTPSVKYEVIPETVGQFTGLLDKNGKEIYEGDIIQDESNSIGVIMWFGTGWGIASYARGFNGINSYTAVDSFYSDEVKEWTILGNVYDNPELLERGSHD